MGFSPEQVRLIKNQSAVYIRTSRFKLKPLIPSVMSTTPSVLGEYGGTPRF
jgi:hypothetical protein